MKTNERYTVGACDEWKAEIYDTQSNTHAGMIELLSIHQGYIPVEKLAQNVCDVLNHPAPRTGWRPVSEKPDLPVGGRALLSLGWGWGRVEIGRWDGQGWRTVGDIPVLGWMPLPEPLPVTYAEVPVPPEEIKE